MGDLSYERAIDGVPYLLAPFIGRVISLDQPLGRYRLHNANLSSFSTLSSDRMDGYMTRFLARLRHLKELVDARGLKDKIQLRHDYAYIQEMKMLSVVASGKRPTAHLLASYRSAIHRENETLSKRYASLVFAVGLFALPDEGRRRLASFRLDPSRHWKIRSRLKQAITVSN